LAGCIILRPPLSGDRALVGDQFLVVVDVLDQLEDFHFQPEFAFFQQATLLAAGAEFLDQAHVFVLVPGVYLVALDDLFSQRSDLFIAQADHLGQG